MEVLMKNKKIMFPRSFHVSLPHVEYERIKGDAKILKMSINKYIVKKIQENFSIDDILKSNELLKLEVEKTVSSMDFKLFKILNSVKQNTNLIKLKSDINLNLMKDFYVSQLVDTKINRETAVKKIDNIINDIYEIVSNRLDDLNEKQVEADVITLKKEEEREWIFWDGSENIIDFELWKKTIFPKAQAGIIIKQTSKNFPHKIRLSPLQVEKYVESDSKGNLSFFGISCELEELYTVVFFPLVYENYVLNVRKKLDNQADKLAALKPLELKMINRRLLNYKKPSLILQDDLDRGYAAHLLNKKSFEELENYSNWLLKLSKQKTKLLRIIKRLPKFRQIDGLLSSISLKEGKEKRIKWKCEKGHIFLDSISHMEKITAPDYQIDNVCPVCTEEG